jgi:hypothetical protein
MGGKVNHVAELLFSKLCLLSFHFPFEVFIMHHLGIIMATAE